MSVLCSGRIVILTSPSYVYLRFCCCLVKLTTLAPTPGVPTVTGSFQTNTCCDNIAVTPPTIIHVSHATLLEQLAQSCSHITTRQDTLRFAAAATMGGDASEARNRKSISITWQTRMFVGFVRHILKL